MKRIISTLFLHVFFALSLFAQQDFIKIDKEKLPKIERLSSKDDNFRQFEDSLSYNNKIFYSTGGDYLVEFYAYTVRKGEDILSIAAFTNLGYDTIASLNGIDSSSSSISGTTLVLPVIKGVFIAEKASSSLEILLKKEMLSEGEKGEKSALSLKTLRTQINGRRYKQFIGSRFTPTSRAYFLSSSLTLPVDRAVISSPYGYRISPVLGKWKFHEGIDFAAKEGSPVYAVKSGKVAQAVKGNAVYGNYIVIKHSENLTSLYAHLSVMLVKKGDEVMKGCVIGRVGHTGMATGSHLHFELKVGGKKKDPASMLPL